MVEADEEDDGPTERSIVKRAPVVRMVIMRCVQAQKEKRERSRTDVAGKMLRAEGVEMTRE